ncbi:MAG: PIN domain nuclease [Anaerolinea sp.]|nr:PIN domain nuclease [Anaerolinea sp.]
MKVLVDSSAWSLRLRRRQSLVEDPVARALDALVGRHEAAIIGPVKQELLTGIRDASQFARLQRALAAFPDEPLLTIDYETAADFANRARRVGIQGSNVDFLVCAVAARLGVSILAADRDFERFATMMPIRLYPAV